MVLKWCRIPTEQITGVFDLVLARRFLPAFGHLLEGFLESLSWWRLGFKDFEFRVSGLGFRIWDLGLRVEG